MSRLIQLFIASSLDGYIARKSGEVDWLFTDDDYGYETFYSDVDTVLMGHKTYQKTLSFGEYPYADKKSYIFSRSVNHSGNSYIEFITNQIVEFITQLRQSPGKNIWLVGGGEMIQLCLKHRLIDELILSIHPIILGDGIPLITRDSSLEMDLQLQEVKTYNTGLLQVIYTFNSKPR